MFLCYNTVQVAGFFATNIQDIPVIGKYASRIGATVSEFIFTIVQTLLTFLRIVFSKKDVWSKVVTSVLYSLFTVVLK